MRAVLLLVVLLGGTQALSILSAALQKLGEFVVILVIYLGKAEESGEREPIEPIAPNKLI